MFKAYQADLQTQQEWIELHIQFLKLLFSAVWSQTQEIIVFGALKKLHKVGFHWLHKDYKL